MFEFFYKSTNCFSQWYPCEFKVANLIYNCAEQYMMAEKAILFNDLESHEKIMSSNSPRKQKALGRSIKNFNSLVWNVHREDIIYKGNYHKFTQNPELLDILLNTKGKKLVEASPYDKIWGIGLSKEDPRSLDESKWLGLNLLGKTLDRLRGHLLEEINYV